MKIRLYSSVAFGAFPGDSLLSYTFNSPMTVRSAKVSVDLSGLTHTAAPNVEISSVPFNQFTAPQSSPDTIGLITGSTLASGIQPDALPVNRRFNVGERIYVHGSAGVGVSGGVALIWMELEIGDGHSGRDRRGRYS